MARAESAQLNIRSRFARERAAMLARRTGLTATQVVEEALRAYQPPPDVTAPLGLVREGAILVKASTGKPITLDEANNALDGARAERG